MLWQGILHIWLGWDHLAFVLCLCTLARGLKLLALSIVLVAREGLLAHTESQRRGSVSRTALVVVVFGLVHGLGFASALGELGISAGERWPALLFFNLGVEIGQVVFVTALLAIGIALRPAVAATARAVALYGAGIVGSFWLVERVAGYGWG